MTFGGRDEIKLITELKLPTFSAIAKFSAPNINIPLDFFAEYLPSSETENDLWDII